MFDKLDDILYRYEEVLNELSEPEVLGDADRYQKLMKEQADLEPVVTKYKEYKEKKTGIEDSLAMLEEETDEELRELAKEELNECKGSIEKIEQELKILLLPRDPNDDKNVIVEIRAGAGGDEAALFAADLYRMYCKYAESNRWRIDTMNSNENGIGGFKEIVFMINGAGAYSKLKYESGVHRVQRIPATESGGRIHTSTAVRLTHIPTGIVISCQDEKSQLKNKDKALKVLRARLYELEKAKAHDAEAEERRSQIGTGDRSEKIRTYNYPQGRVTDHRIKLTLHRLDAIINGDISEVVDSLIAADQAAKLAKMSD